MVELLINKVIGEDWWEQYTGVQEEISANYVRDQLKAFPENEKELRIVIDSPGGDVFEGVTIFNVIRDFARNNPSVKITTYIQGMAASMASAIALAANAVSDSNKVIAEDNSIFMIHDAWGYVIGNQNDMREAAEYFAMIDSMLSSIYMRKTGKSEDDIRSMMDAETWLWGKNILEAGFVDEIIDSEKNADESANMN
ncbi:MAG: Clp protease ClpP, partial [Treponema sp.]|nr:Clp protease ClpP [Treponema sp.]